MAETTSSPRSRSLAPLLEAVRQGDRRAFDRLCTPDAVQLWLVMIGASLPVWLRAKVDPEDLLQETLDRAWRSIDSLRDETEVGFHRWVAGIARHVVAEQIRRFRQQKRDVVREEDYHVSASSGVYGVRNTPSQSVWRRERLARIVGLLDGLKESYRTVIVHRILEGYSNNEAAEKLGITPDNASVLLHRALTKLRALADQQGICSTFLRPL